MDEPELFLMLVVVGIRNVVGGVVVMVVLVVVVVVGCENGGKKKKGDNFRLRRKMSPLYF